MNQKQKKIIELLLEIVEAGDCQCNWWFSDIEGKMHHDKTAQICHACKLSAQYGLIPETELRELRKMIKTD